MTHILGARGQVNLERGDELAERQSRMRKTREKQKIVSASVTWNEEKIEMEGREFESWSQRFFLIGGQFIHISIWRCHKDIYSFSFCLASI